MSYIDVARELKKSIQIMTNTFEQNNLQILNITCRPRFADDPDFLYVIIEIASIDGIVIPSSLDIKLNLYNCDGELFRSEGVHLFADEFSGYDTITISIYDDSHTLDIAAKGRLYVTRSVI